MLPFRKKDLLFFLKKRKEFASGGANSFLSELTPDKMGGNNENDRAASLKNVPIHLKVQRYTFVNFLPFLQQGTTSATSCLLS